MDVAFDSKLQAPRKIVRPTPVMNNDASRFFAKGHLTRVTSRGNKNRKSAGTIAHVATGHESLPSTIVSTAQAASQLRSPHSNQADSALSTQANTARASPSWRKLTQYNPRKARGQDSHPPSTDG